MSTTDQLRRLAVIEETQKIKVDGPMPGALVFNVALRCSCSLLAWFPSTLRFATHRRVYETITFSSVAVYNGFSAGRF
jgi:hypothetical protein